MKKIWLSIFCITQVVCYDQPVTINLGFNNILEGGPIRPIPGFYWYQYFEYYHSNIFRDQFGNRINTTKNPNFNTFYGCTELIYQTKNKILFNALAGVDLQVYYALYEKIEHNDLGFNTSGPGGSDPYVGLFLQWDPIKKPNGEELLIHRFELGASFPAGKFKPRYFFNPGNGCYYINPSWAATLYFTPKCATSTQLNFVWSSPKKGTHVQPGQAIFLNYSFECETIKNLWLSVCGYYLQQITDSRINGVKVPGRKERVLAVGPGVLYSVNDDLSFFAYGYIEKLVKNRPQGATFLLRWVVHF